MDRRPGTRSLLVVDFVYAIQLDQNHSALSDNDQVAGVVIARTTQ